MAQQGSTSEPEAKPSIHGDVLESILSHVPLIHLLSASRVSTSWNRAVSSSLAHLNPVKPWLILHAHSSRSPYLTATHAYDPRSHLWLDIRRPNQSSLKLASSALRSSHSSLFYVLSPTVFAFSFDPLHLTWHHAEAPRVWRVDPIVARVGRCIVVAGGACDFEDDPLAVEVYDPGTRTWTMGPSMPEILKDSTASTWLSVAVDEQRMHVTEKSSGITYSFDPNAEIWDGPYDLRPNQNVYSCVIGTLHNRLIVAGLVGNMENLNSVKLWEVRGEMGKEFWWMEMGEMPKEMVKKLKGESECVASIAMNAMGDFVYIHNPSEPAEMIVGEIVNGTCKWRDVPNVVMKDKTRMQRMVVGCSDVSLGDLQKAVSENRNFAVKIRAGN
ncbi:F-box/kelch-repeat protein At1g23390-like [Neltuma alba]|uniref:F-box/kelch-repeat protein At1g23390-like n=1 Tax=Neltuma alba TaxID=207710 RepID=UPI0010A51979|nr:F-box/kelch-repeat protein At1g23390-like [Prosopis alba]